MLQISNRKLCSLCVQCEARNSLPESIWRRFEG